MAHKFLKTLTFDSQITHKSLTIRSQIELTITKDTHNDFSNCRKTSASALRFFVQWEKMSI